MIAAAPLHIAAVSVNHNTSAYMELLLRSFFACHPVAFPLSFTIFDNDSTDDMLNLQRFAAAMHVPIVPSGFSLKTQHNSHGDILRRFVLDHPDCTHYLFLDADVCFVQPNTIGIMVQELQETADVFGIGARMSWDGINEIPNEIRQANPDICDARLHPCCALVANTRLFRQIVEEIGFSCVNYLWADHAEYLDTFKLMTRVMHTHGLRHTVSSAMVQHFFCVSYEYDDEATRQYKRSVRDQRLEALRALE